MLDGQADVWARVAIQCRLGSKSAQPPNWRWLKHRWNSLKCRQTQLDGAKQISWAESRQCHNSYGTKFMCRTLLVLGKNNQNYSTFKYTQPARYAAKHQRSTCIDNQRRTTIRKSACLLTIRSLAFTFKMADNIDSQIKIDNKNYLPQNQRPQNYSHNRKGKGSGLTNSR